MSALAANAKPNVSRPSPVSGAKHPLTGATNMWGVSLFKVVGLLQGVTAPTGNKDLVKVLGARVLLRNDGIKHTGENQCFDVISS